MDFAKNYLKSVEKQFRHYKDLGERAMAQLEDGQLFLFSNGETNSIAVIVKHLHGNMLSRWSHFLTTDGEKPWRNRDSEFIQDIDDKKALMEMWEQGWQCLFRAIESIEPGELLNNIFIRGEALTVTEAINRQLTHYAYHVGQIVFAARQLKLGEWESLSIPKKK